MFSQLRNMVLLGASCSLLVACAPAEFVGSTSSKASQDDSSGVVGQEGLGDDSTGRVGQNGGRDDADGRVPQMTADEAAGMVEELLAGQDPTPGALEQIVEGEFKSLRCYISGSGGHGIDMCMQDTSGIRDLAIRQEQEGTYLEIKGSQLCVPLHLLLTETDRLATAVTGECR
ncbi:MAG: hypothetical protein AB7F86_14145 [Bdellovibrionales bacterium]